ncbi:DUF2231 domain-containing protein [Nocardioides pelophilus]|uniref:DUF2231 domain-containing protein n=1 Tax=Nocardioides pelophilus TaxID=2172019 RepID=UPI001601FEA7|nr:DUF2231 domain-containing protein [Nocardioides pelophilus]
MFDQFNGLPVHPLVVHAVVVLLPLAVVGTWAIALVPRWRPRYGPLVVAGALLSVALIPVATSSGEELAHRVGEPEAHEELGESLLWFAVPLLVLVVVLVWLSHRQSRAQATSDPSDPTGPRATRLVTAVAVLAALAGLATAVQVYRVGDSGAEATWGSASR